MNNNNKKSAILLASVVLASLGLTATASATPISVGALTTFEDRGTAQSPDSDLFVIRNDSDSGIQITSITIDLSGTLNGAVFNTIDGFQDGSFDYGDNLGYPIAGLNSGVVGLATPSAGEQSSWEEAQSITLSFTDFDPGELFLFTTDLDDQEDWRVFGFEMASASFSATFAGGSLSGDLTLSSLYVNNTDTGKATDAIAQIATTVPEPGSLALLGVGLLGMFVRLRGTAIR